MIENKKLNDLLERSKQNKRAGFNLPVNYFDVLQKQLANKKDQQDEAKVIPLASGPGRMAAGLMVAASFLAIIMLVYIPSDSESLNTQISFINYSTDDLNSYLEDNLDEMDLMAYADESDYSILLNSNEFKGIENNSIEEFLVDEIDFDEIYNN